MNFNKDYPIAILDTNIVMDVPNILYILKGCNIVIPFTLIEELDNHKKENKGARDFVNNFLALSEKANLSKDGYKLENDCMLYLDMDKNNLSHKEIDLSYKKQDIKFIAKAKNLKEKYNDMEVVLISSDKIMKITASTFDVKVKNLEDFIMEYFKLDINELYELAEKYDYYGGYRKIFKILLENKDIDGLYKLAENKSIEESNKNIIYKEIFEILLENKDINGLYKLAENSNLSHSDKKTIYKTIFQILLDDKDVKRLYELANNYKSAYKGISKILFENKDIDELYKLSKNEDIGENNKKDIYEKIFEILSDTKDIYGLYKFAKNYDYYEHNAAYNKIFEILSENRDIGGLYGLAENDNYNSEIKRLKRLKIELFLDKKYIYEKIFEILSEDKDIDGLYKLAHNGDMINAFKDMQDITITDVITGKSVNTTRKLSNRISDRIVELENKK